MDNGQTIINWVFTIVMAVIGGLIKIVYGRLETDLKKLAEQHDESLKTIHELALNLGSNYAPRSEIEKSLQEIKDTMRRIEERVIENKR